MPVQLTLSIGGLVEFKSGLPPDYAGPIIPGAIAFSAKTNIAQLVIQELTGHHYSFRFSLAKFLTRVTGWGNVGREGLHAYFMLKNGLRKEIQSVGKFHVREGQSACIYTEPSACKVIFEKNIDYSLLDLYYSPKLAEELTFYFPELKDVIQSGRASIISGKAIYAVPAIKELAHQLLHCPYDAQTSQFYFDLKVREFLFELLINTYRRKPADRYFTPWEVSKIHEARSILYSHISQKPPTIRALSKQVALNAFKLKTGFRQYFHSGIFEWLMDEKMQEARRLVLNSNKPVKEISSLVGYSRTTNFITAFRHCFGVTPGGLRRK